MDLAHELHDLVLTLDRWAGAALADVGLNYNRYVALVIVGEHPGITGRQLAGGLRISEPSTSAIVRRLIADGLVRNASAQGSDHVRRLELTETGRELRARAGEVLGDSLDANARAIDPAELAATIRALHDEGRTTREDS